MSLPPSVFTAIRPAVFLLVAGMLLPMAPAVRAAPNLSSYSANLRAPSISGCASKSYVDRTTANSVDLALDCATTSVNGSGRPGMAVGRVTFGQGSVSAISHFAAVEMEAESVEARGFAEQTYWMTFEKIGSAPVNAPVVVFKGIGAAGVDGNPRSGSESITGSAVVSLFRSDGLQIASGGATATCVLRNCTFKSSSRDTPVEARLTLTNGFSYYVVARAEVIVNSLVGSGSGSFGGYAVADPVFTFAPDFLYASAFRLSFSTNLPGVKAIPHAVPEPSTWLTLATGLACLLGFATQGGRARRAR